MGELGRPRGFVGAERGTRGPTAESGQGVTGHVPRDWRVSTGCALVRSQRADEDTVCGTLPTREVGMALTGHRESGKASWKRGSFGS